MPKKPDSSADAISRSVTNALGSVQLPDGPKRPPHKKLRAEVEARKAEYHEKLRGGARLSQLHRSLVEELTKLGIKPIAYNTLKLWLSPLP